MTTVIDSDALIPLRNGPTVRESVVLWLLGAEDRGLRFKALEDGSLHVGPRRGVSDDDLLFVRQHRDELLACVRYIAQQEAAPL